MAVRLGFNTHGKGRVRLVKVMRGKDGTHNVIQYNVQVLLEGDNMDEVFLTGNNRQCVATDTCKNTVYCVANNNTFSSMEEFGILLCKHFLNEYPAIVNKVNIQIKADNWERIVAPNSKGKMGPHKHAFLRKGPQQSYTHVSATKRPRTPMNFSITSGVRDVEIMKTTQSGFEGFHRNRYTSLPETRERLLGTSMEAEWNFADAKLMGSSNIERIEFNKLRAQITDALVHTFAGPSDKGVYSPSVQETLHKMGEAALGADKFDLVESIVLQMPNIHNIAFPLEKYGLKNEDHTGVPDIFFPTDEPHGMIKAEIYRANKAKARL